MNLLLCPIFCSVYLLVNAWMNNTVLFTGTLYYTLLSGELNSPTLSFVFLNSVWARLALCILESACEVLHIPAPLEYCGILIRITLSILINLRRLNLCNIMFPSPRSWHISCCTSVYLAVIGTQ